MKIFTATCLIVGLFVFTRVAAAADEKEEVMQYLDDHQEKFATIAKQIWDFAEVGYQEEKSSALLQSELEAEGFEIRRGVADMPTAFVASYGQGKPVIGLIAEFDALPGLSQDVVPEKKPITSGAPGHGCGHHLYGTGSTAAAIALKDWLTRTNTTGTVRLYGTPAEEGGGGKVYMVRAGLFDDVDSVITWHPGDQNGVGRQRSLANKSAKFRFYGQSAHAAGAPEQGRSALDGVEAMNTMVNMMREHVPASSRIHYVITHGGDAPNTVPDFAEVYYYCRHPEIEMAKSNFEWIVKAAEGAATGNRYSDGLRDHPRVVPSVAQRNACRADAREPRKRRRRPLHAGRARLRRKNRTDAATTQASRHGREGPADRAGECGFLFNGRGRHQLVGAHRFDGGRDMGSRYSRS